MEISGYWLWDITGHNTSRRTWGVITCSGLVGTFTVELSGELSWDCFLHRPLVVSLNIMSFSNKLSCLAIGHTRGLLQEIINTRISLLPTWLYKSEITTTGHLNYRQLFYSRRKQFLNTVGKKKHNGKSVSLSTSSEVHSISH